jgi:hypothetical protein
MLDRFTAFDPATEVAGFTIIPFVRSMWAEDVEEVFVRYGFDKSEPDAWYLQQKWLDCLTELYKRPDAQNRMVSVGLKVGVALPFPPEVKTLRQALEFTSVAMDHSHRKGRWGSVTVETIGDTHLRTISFTPYPDDAAYGTNWSIVKRFLPAPADFRIVSNFAGVRRFPEPDQDPLILDIAWRESPEVVGT